MADKDSLLRSLGLDSASRNTQTYFKNFFKYILAVKIQTNVQHGNGSILYKDTKQLFGALPLLCTLTFADF